ncbi:MAG: hypothetical protein RBS92_04595, partial [Candidatus Cloacimonadales bacterium]|nr:hypothetical protein [Candidatus Cloacimonadales bacterium]
MSEITLGIPFFDQVLNDLEKEEIYGVRANNTKMSVLFLIQVMKSQLEAKKRFMLVCDSKADIFSDEFNLHGFDVKPYIENNDLLIIEQPPELSSILSSLNNLDIVFEDLKVYIKDYMPDVIYFESLGSFLSKNNVSPSKIIINRFIGFIESLNITCFIDYSNIEYDLQLLFDKLVSTSLAFKQNNKANVHQMTYKNQKTGFIYNFVFSIEGNKHFVKPILQHGSTSISINDIDTVYINKESKQLEEILKRTLTKQAKYVVYDTLEKLTEIIKHNNNLIFIPNTLDNKNGFEAAYKIKQEHPNIKVVLVIEDSICTNQKARFIRMGIDRLITLPFSNEKVQNLLLKLSPTSSQVKQKTNISVLYTKDIEFIVDNNSLTYFDNVYRLLKENLYDTIAKAGSVLFVKIKFLFSDTYRILEILKQSENLMCVFSNQISEKEVHLIAAYKNISEKAKQQIYAQIKIG